MRAERQTDRQYSSQYFAPLPVGQVRYWMISLYCNSPQRLLFQWLKWTGGLRGGHFLQDMVSVEAHTPAWGRGLRIEYNMWTFDFFHHAVFINRCGHKQQNPRVTRYEILFSRPSVMDNVKIIIRDYYVRCELERKCRFLIIKFRVTIQSIDRA